MFVIEKFLLELLPREGLGGSPPNQKNPATRRSEAKTGGRQGSRTPDPLGVSEML